MTTQNEVFAKAKEDFVFNDGLTLTNMPRLKTGSIATYMYIVPTSLQKAGTAYNLTYRKGAVDVFDLTNNGKLAAGTMYFVAPMGAWAAASQVTLTTK